MHVPVLYEELISYMNIKPQGVYVDCTGGGGGHAAMVAQRLNGGRLIILDRDPHAVKRLKEKFSDNKNVEVLHGNFKDAAFILKDHGIGKLSGLYADFGVSSFQLDEAERGFSFRFDGILDMRLNPETGESAKDVVNKYSEDQLAEIIYRYGEEKFYKRIARAIVKRRLIKPFSSTLDFAAVVKQAIPAKFHKHGYNPATQTFQALRIHVNEELGAIEMLLRSIPELMKIGGRVAFISFHSLEDRLVKDYLVRYDRPCICPPEFPVCNCGKKQQFKLLTKKPVTASEKELKNNPLSRSAKLRAAERVDDN